MFKERFWDLLNSWIPYFKSAGRVLVVLAIALFVYFLLARTMRLAQRRGGLSAPVRSVLVGLLRWSIFLLTLFLILGEVGVLQNVWAALVGILAMIAIGFVAVWSVMSNVLCTLLILVVRPFRIGDIVEMPSESLKGRAVNLNLIFTTLLDEEGRYIQIPNNLIFQKPIRKTEGEFSITLWEQLNSEKNHQP